MPTTVTVLLFAGLRQRAGASSLEVPLEGDETTVARLREQIADRWPDLRPGLAQARVAIDQEFAGDDDIVRVGQELALIPPVSGGHDGPDPDPPSTTRGRRSTLTTLPLALADVIAAHVDVETGVEAGDLVGMDYDPMLAKLVAHGPDRATALARLDRALATTRIVGPTTNRGYLRALLQDPAVRENAVDTGYLERAVHGAPPTLAADAVRLAVADRLRERGERARFRAVAAGDLPPL